jgi:hypothetical protein
MLNTNVSAKRKTIKAINYMILVDMFCTMLFISGSDNCDLYINIITKPQLVMVMSAKKDFL